MAKASEASVRLMREQTNAMNRPYVTISLCKVPDDPFIFMRVENTGRTPAENLTLSLGPDFEKIRGFEKMQQLASAYMFNHTIETFAPNSPVLFLIGSGSFILGDERDKFPQQIFSITAKYSFCGHTVAETTVIDVNQYGRTILESDRVARALKDIKEEINKLSR